MNVKATLRKFGAWLRVSGFSWLVCAVLFVADEGTIGKLWAERQAAGYEMVGYIVAIGLDLAAALALDRMAHAKLRKHKVLAGLVFGLACGVSAFFGVQYYRQFSPSDPVVLSVAMGCVCPVLAASIALLRGMTLAHENVLEMERQDVDREAARVMKFELRKMEIAQSAETALLLEKETTKQTRAKARATRAKTEAAVEKEKREIERKEDLEREKVTHAQAAVTIGQALATVGYAMGTLRYYAGNPTATQVQAAESLGISRRTVGNHLSHAESLGIVKRNGQGVEVIADLGGITT